MTRLPFGKYKGLPVEHVPDDYLVWLASIDLRPFLRRAVDSELAARGLGRAEHHNNGNAIATYPKVDPSLGLALVDAGRKALARKHHPDRGGDPTYMAAVNAAADRLRTWFAGRAA